MYFRDINLKKLFSLARHRRNVWVIWGIELDEFGIFSKNLLKEMAKKDFFHGMYSGWCSPSNPNYLHDSHCKICPDCGVATIGPSAEIGLLIFCLYKFGRPYIVEKRQAIVWTISASVLIVCLKLLDKNPEEFQEILTSVSSKKDLLALAAIV